MLIGIAIWALGTAIVAVSWALRETVEERRTPALASVLIILAVSLVLWPLIVAAYALRQFVGLVGNGE